VQQSGNSSIQAIYSFVPRSYARDRLCLVGDAGTVFPPFTGSGVRRAVANAASLTDALAGAQATDDALRRWSEAQLQVAAQVLPIAEGIERSYVFGMQTSPPCQRRRPTTGCPPPIPGSWSPFPACDWKCLEPVSRGRDEQRLALHRPQGGVVGGTQAGMNYGRRRAASWRWRADSLRRP